MSLRRSLLGLAAFGVLISAAHPAAAQEPAPAPEPTFETARGTLTGSTRRIGLGGAFVALADDTEGVGINAASVAVRVPYSWSTWNSALGLDVSIGAWLPKNDLYNQGGADGGSSSALFGSLAAVINYEHAGFGVAAEAQRNAATRRDEAQGIGTNLAANFGMVHTSLAYGFFDGQLLLGAGPRIVGLSFGARSSSGPLTAGIGYEAGAIVKPTWAQYRAAAAVKSPINATVAADPGAPRRYAHVPWEVALGFAYQFGARPLNPKFVTAEELARQRQPAQGAPLTKAELKAADDELFDAFQRRQRWYLLVSTELSVIQGGGHVGLAGHTALSRAIISPRLGAETEVVPHILRLRGGSYYEPAQVAEATGRVHGTGGFDVRLFRWNLFGLIGRFDYWQLSVSADAARAYLNTAFSIGFWH